MKTISLIIFCCTIFNSAALAQSSFLDSTFGDNGIVITPLGPGLSGSFGPTIIQPDNKIVTLCGRGVMRYNPNGTLDITFGAAGTFTLPNRTTEHGLVLQPDGKLVIVGGILDTAVSNASFLAVRLDSNGTLDSAFGNNGIASARLSTMEGYSGNAAAIQADGKIILAGSVNNTSIGLARFSPNGVPDSTFGNYGIVVTGSWAIPAWGTGIGVAVMPDERIVVGCEASPVAFQAIRCLADGSPDTTFNHSGIAKTYPGGGFNYCHAMQLQPDGKVILAGAAEFDLTGNDFAVIRYNVDGSLDRYFGDTGIAHIDFSGGDDEATGLCLAPDGKIIVAGDATFIGVTFGLSRLDTNGVIDSAFGNNGRISTLVQDGPDLLRASTLENDGKIVVAGWSYNATIYGNEATMVRYLAIPATGIPHVIHVAGNVALFPNPSGGALNLNGDIRDITLITVFDALGNKVYSDENHGKQQIMVTQLSNGFYLFKISFSDRLPVVQKILIQNK